MYRGASHFNPRAPRGARHQRRNNPSVQNYISIHAPRVGRDNVGGTSTCLACDFNPRAPRGARLGISAPILPTRPFQSTRPAWGATLLRWSARHRVSISIHAPRVGRDLNGAAAMSDDPISIHAPRVGRDLSESRSLSESPYFNPRAPRGARLPRPSPAVRAVYFNPRAPRGARQAGDVMLHLERQFQSTRPAWGATPICHKLLLQIQISIHAPRVGRDLICSALFPFLSNFNPRAPRGARHRVLASSIGAIVISIHAPRVGRDDRMTSDSNVKWIFQSTRPAWGATTSLRGL